MKALIALALVAILLSPARSIAQQCAQPISSGPKPVATDCLFILNAAVGLQTCDVPCVCDVDGSGNAPSATDALICLNVAIGIEVPLDCPCGTSTTLTSTTLSSSTTLPGSTTTVTATSLSSTTTNTSTTLFTTTTLPGSSSTTLTSTTLSSTTTTNTLPGGDTDNDGLPSGVDPCPDEALNRCAGIIAIDGLTLRDIRINAVNPGDPLYAFCSGERVDCNGDLWERDFGWNHQAAAFACNLGEEACAIEGVEDVFGCTDENTALLFRCEHYGSPILSNLTYSFAVADGSYIVNLLFGNIYDQTAAAGSRVFDVAIESQLVLDDFDQVIAAGGSGRAVARSLLVDVSGGDGLQIEFIPGVQNPAIKGIEVLARVN